MVKVFLVVRHDDGLLEDLGSGPIDVSGAI
ncbi:hypothetical protein sphantq_01717 [Sphingobium sp. AntQ-1]|nr:hypothetical protein sphantq_01717 [Sphingobium sp. AntQ-1]